MVDMSICRLRLGLGLKFEIFSFDWRFLSQIRAWKCISYRKVSISWKFHEDWASGSWDISLGCQSQSQSQHENWPRCSCLIGVVNFEIKSPKMLKGWGWFFSVIEVVKCSIVLRPFPAFIMYWIQFIHEDILIGL